jgi:hypothetical protein
MRGESELNNAKCAFDNINVIKPCSKNTGTYEIDYGIRVAVKYIPYSHKAFQAQGYRKDI